MGRNADGVVLTLSGPVVSPPLPQRLVTVTDLEPQIPADLGSSGGSFIGLRKDNSSYNISDLLSTIQTGPSSSDFARAVLLAKWDGNPVTPSSPLDVQTTANLISGGVVGTNPATDLLGGDTRYGTLVSGNITAASGTGSTILLYYLTSIFVLTVGSVTGTPTTWSVKLQGAVNLNPTFSAGWYDILTISSADGFTTKFSFNLFAANMMRYSVSFTGGTTPTASFELKARHGP